MKKTVLIILAILSFVLVACAKQEGSKTFKLEAEGINILLTYYFEGDQVVKQESKSQVNFDLLGFESKEKAEEFLLPQVEQYKDVTGLTHTYEFTDTSLNEETMVDYKTLDFEKALTIPSLGITEEHKSGKISMKASEQLLKSQGFVEVK